MQNILVVESSPRGAASVSRKLTGALLMKLKAANPAATVQVRDLTAHPAPHLDESHLAGFFAPPDKISDRDRQAIGHSDAAIAEILHADTIVIGVPMYNFSIPSVLKAWIDQIVRANRTFRYTATGAEGLVTGKKVFLALATGGLYLEGTMKSYDFVEPYLRAILGFMGMTDVTAYRAEGIMIPGVQDTALEKAINSIHL